MATGLTADQVNIALEQLSDATKFRIWPMVVETVLFSLFTVLIVFSTIVLVSRGVGSWPVRAMLALTFFGYAVAALDWASDMKTLWNVMNIFLPQLLSPGVKNGQDADVALSAQVNVWGSITEITSTYSIVVSDAVALWRAQVLWEWRRGIFILSLVIFSCLVGVSITNGLVVASANISSAPASLHPLLSQAEAIAMLFCSMSTFINLYSTAIIAWKAWLHRREMRRLLQDTTRQTVEGILTLIVESDTLYSLFMVIYIVTVIPSVTLDKALDFHWSAVMNQVAGTYPTLVVVIIAPKKSHCEHQGDVELGAMYTLPFTVRALQTQTGELAHSASLHLRVIHELSDPDISEVKIDGMDKSKEGVECPPM